MTLTFSSIFSTIEVCQKCDWVLPCHSNRLPSCRKEFLAEWQGGLAHCFQIHQSFCESHTSKVPSHLGLHNCASSKLSHSIPPKQKALLSDYLLLGERLTLETQVPIKWSPWSPQRLCLKYASLPQWKHLHTNFIIIIIIIIITRHRTHQVWQTCCCIKCDVPCMRKHSQKSPEFSPNKQQTQKLTMFCGI